MVMTSSSKAPALTGYDRGKWKRSVEFVLTVMGYTIGVGTLWRFPYMCIRNGGGAFLFTYCVSVITCSIPLFLLESCVGQYFGRSSLVVWNIVPLFKGVGVVGTLLSTCCAIYYNSLVSWCLYYTAMTFSDPIPWTTCGNPWNSPSCVSLGGVVNQSSAVIWTGNRSKEAGGVLSSEEFWQRHVLGISPGVEDIGSLNWKTSLCLCAAWLITFLVLCKGINSSRLVVYVTATLPILLMLIIMVKGATLPGAVDGVIFFIVPKWEKLGTYQVWLEGFLAGIYSMGAGWGAVTTFSSHSDFHNNVIKDCLVLGFMIPLASVLSGFAIFTMLGHASYITSVPIDQLPNSGPGLSFVTYPFTAASLPVPQLWSFLFFACVFFLAVDSQFAMVEVFIGGICDAFPKTVGKRKTLTALIFCIFSNIISLLFMTQGGMYYYVLVDWYISALSVVTVNFVQSFAIGWVYGIDRFVDHVREMVSDVNPRLLTALKYIWKYDTTLSTFIVIVVTMAQLKAPTYAAYLYPDWAVALGWTISVVLVCPLPVAMLSVLAKQKGPLLKRLRNSLAPTTLYVNHQNCEKCFRKDTQLFTEKPLNTDYEESPQRRGATKTDTP